MKDYDVVLFDLDGTLVDTGLGITNSVMYSLKKFGIKVEERQFLYRFVGPPLHKSFEEFYGFSPEQAMQAVEYYREYYKDKGIFEITVYDGIENFLKTLKYSKKTLAVATSKPEVFAKRILKYVGFDKYFDVIAGANLDGTRTQKSDVVEYALKICNVTDLSKTVIIGDRKYDVYGANTVGIDSVGVTFGYGNRSELVNAGADYIADSAEDLINLFEEQKPIKLS